MVVRCCHPCKFSRAQARSCLRFLAPWRHPRGAPSSHTTSPAAMSGIQVPPRSLRVDADAQDADGRAQPRRLFTEPSTASSDEPEPPGTPEATRVPPRAPLRVADGREPLFTGPSSTHEPETPTTPRTRIRRQLPESWQSPGDWAPEHNINPNPVRRKVFGGLLILGVAVIGVVSVGGVPMPKTPAACICLLPAHDMSALDSAGRFEASMGELAGQGALSVYATAPAQPRPPLPPAQPPLPSSWPPSPPPAPPPSAASRHGRRSQSTS